MNSTKDTIESVKSILGMVREGAILVVIGILVMTPSAIANWMDEAGLEEFGALGVTLKSQVEEVKADTESHLEDLDGIIAEIEKIQREQERAATTPQTGGSAVARPQLSEILSKSTQLKTSLQTQAPAAAPRIAQATEVTSPEPRAEIIKVPETDTAAVEPAPANTTVVAATSTVAKTGGAAKATMATPPAPAPSKVAQAEMVIPITPPPGTKSDKLAQGQR